MLTACQEVGSDGTAKIIIEKRVGEYLEYDINLSELNDKNEGTYSLLKYLKEEKGLEYSIEDSGYGAFVNSIAGLTPNASLGEYVSLYTNEESDFAVPSEWMPTVPTVKYGEVTLTSSGVGISSMTVKDGTVILFRIESFTG